VVDYATWVSLGSPGSRRLRHWHPGGAGSGRHTPGELPAKLDRKEMEVVVPMRARHRKKPQVRDCGGEDLVRRANLAAAATKITSSLVELVLSIWSHLR